MVEKPEKVYDCPICGAVMEVGGWSIEVVGVWCNECEYQTNELALKDATLYDFLKGKSVDEVGARVK